MTEPSLATQIRSPLSGVAFRDLFVRPTTYFQTVDLAQGRAWFVATWLLGMASALGQVDKNILRANLGRPRPGWDIFGPAILNSWPTFWLFLLGMGLIAGAMLWFVGGWWYNLRIRWSGASAHDKRTGRLVYVFSGLVAAVPSLAYAAVATGLYDNYGMAWEAEETWSTLLLLFPFWSVIVSYRGVRTRFPVDAGRALVWFLLLPFGDYILAYGLLGLAYSLMTGSGEGVAA